MQTTTPLNCLDIPGTQYPDLPGILSLNISNFFTEDSTYLPHSEQLLTLGQMMTSKGLKGSDVPNLLPQARAILLRKSIVQHVLEGGLFDIVDIVERQYPLGVMHLSCAEATDPQFIYHNLRVLDDLFHQPRQFYCSERVDMILDFERQLGSLYLAELMLHGSEFKIDSILFGLSNMSLSERLLRGRINTYLERFFREKMGDLDKLQKNSAHLEISSNPLDIHERTAQCIQLYNTFGGGAYAKSGILFAGSGSSGTVSYDALQDSFPIAISKFYRERVANS